MIASPLCPTLSTTAFLWFSGCLGGDSHTSFESLASTAGTHTESFSFPNRHPESSSPAPRLLPVTVTSVPPADGPFDGEIALISACLHVACTSSAQSGSGQNSGFNPRLMLRSSYPADLS